MGQKKRETRPSSRAQEPQQVDFGDEETVWSCLTYLPICDQLNILKRPRSVIFAIKSRSPKGIYKYTNHLHELMRLCNTVSLLYQRGRDPREVGWGTNKQSVTQQLYTGFVIVWNSMLHCTTWFFALLGGGQTSSVSHSNSTQVPHICRRQSC